MGMDESGWIQEQLRKRGCGDNPNQGQGEDGRSKWKCHIQTDLGEKNVIAASHRRTSGRKWQFSER